MLSSLLHLFSQSKSVPQSSFGQVAHVLVARNPIISSIISCANYEVRFKKPVITGIIYPQKDGLSFRHIHLCMVQTLLYIGYSTKTQIVQRRLLRE